MNTELGNFLSYLRSPHIETDSLNDLTIQIKKVLIFFVKVSFIRMLVLSPLIFLFEKEMEKALLIPPEEMMIRDASTIFMACVIGPFIEETIFRFYMRYKTIGIVVFGTTLSWLIYLIFSYFVSQNFGLFMALLSSIFFIFVGSNHFDGIKEWIKNNYYVLFYLSTVLFAVFHLQNYDIEKLSFFIGFLAVLFPFFGGLEMGYVRLKYGFMNGALLHSLNNTFMIIIMLLSR